jgi:para-nitrobenzyl esterase
MRFLLILLSAILSISSTVYGSENKVQTTSGITNGYILNGVISWDDIPYAQPPMGDLRWRAPKKLESSEYLNTINSQENNFCVQEPSGLGGSAGDSFFSGTEDCLYLDIKRPEKINDKPLPVMFWIHGGGNTSGLKDLYDFSTMVKKHNVIVVSVNYRLGPFGWFTHPSIQDLQSDLDKTSNFGTLDIIAALEWVQSNISSFGGNPNNVTIFGESAGGHNVLSLLVAKQAKGLFHKAISQSGYTTTYSKQSAYKQTNESSTSKHTSWNIVNKIIKDRLLDITQEENSIEVREFLKSLTAEEFFKYYSERPSYDNLTILTGDGIVIPEIGLTNALSKKEYVYHVPTIAGSNKDEVKLWLASAKYFVDLDYSFFGSIFGVPKVVLKDKDALTFLTHTEAEHGRLEGLMTH